jgi:hypothetical protein
LTIGTGTATSLPSAEIGGGDLVDVLGRAALAHDVVVELSRHRRRRERGGERGGHQPPATRIPHGVA